MSRIKRKGRVKRKKVVLAVIAYPYIEQNKTKVKAIAIEDDVAYRVK